MLTSNQVVHRCVHCVDMFLLLTHLPCFVYVYVRACVRACVRAWRWDASATTVVDAADAHM